MKQPEINTPNFKETYSFLEITPFLAITKRGFFLQENYYTKELYYSTFLEATTRDLAQLNLSDKRNLVQGLSTFYTVNEENIKYFTLSTQENASKQIHALIERRNIILRNGGNKIQYEMINEEIDRLRESEKKFEILRHFIYFASDTEEELEVVQKKMIHTSVGSLDLHKLDVEEKEKIIKALMNRNELVF